MVDLAAIKELYAWMREAKVLYARCGELELRLEPLPASPIVISDSADESDEERRSLEALLYSTGADISPFLRQRNPQ